MKLYDLLNSTVCSPFVIVNPKNLKVIFLSDSLKDLMQIKNYDEFNLSDIFSYEKSLDKIIIDEIKKDEKCFLKNNSSVLILNKFTLDDQNVFITFKPTNQTEEHIEKIKRHDLFRQILIKISTEFISIPVADINNSINKSLKVIGEFNKVDRCYVFQYSDDYKFKSNTHEWCAEGIAPAIEFLQNYPVLKHPFSADLMFSGTPMIVNSLTELPPEASAEKKEFESEGIKSLVILPMMYNNKAIGFIGFDSCSLERIWSEDDIYLLKIIGDIITGGIIREKVQNKIKLSEERYRSFFENSQLGIFHTSIDGRLLRFNQALLNLSGFDDFEEFRREFSPEKRYKNPSDRDFFINELREKGFIKGFETILLKKGNVEFPARMNAKLIKGDDELFIEGFIEDITEKNEYEIALVKAKEQAEKNDQLKSNFLAQVSHEIRTPINTILSFSQLIAEELKDLVSEDLSYSFSTMDSAGKRIIRTIDLILDMSQIQTGTFELIPKRFDITEVIKKLFQEYSYLAEERELEFKVSVLTPKNEVTADVYTVEQILSNLIHNAIKYTDQGSIEIKTMNKDGKNIVEVIDTGIGISKEFLPNLFNEFSQESQGYTRKYEGNGLGLALVKQYCDMNNIKIDVESEKDKGSVFRLTFIKNK